MNTISVEELEKIDSSKITIVDVRPADQYSRGSFPGAVNIPLDEFEERMESVDREKMVYVLCHTGDRSRDCVEKLSDAGYEAVNIEGGYRAYLRLSLSRFMENDAKEQKELKTKEIEHSIIKTFRKTVWRPFTKALNEYQLIQEGDKIAVCISGGKDSMLMAKLLQELKRHGKIHFELVFLVMNPGYNADNWKIIQDNAELLGIPLTVFESDIFDTVAEIENNPCYLCARMRRGYLYSHAKELGCNKIALGHHFDDVIEEFDRIIGKDQIAVFNINDSKNVPGAAKDRHENIGFGHIGFEAINYIVHHADFRDVPKILETPYIPSVENPKKSYAPYKYEIEMLRAGKFDPDMKERIVKEHEKSV